MSFSILAKAICYLSLFIFSSSFAKELTSLQYDARLCSAQLLVINGDLTRLQNDLTRPHHKIGLKQRIAGALGSIAWLCKQKGILLGLNEEDIASLDNKITAMQSGLKTKNWPELKTAVVSLISKMPLDLKPFNFQNTPKETLPTSVSIYKHYCKSCHHKPSDKAEKPAYSLFEMVRNMPRNEFLARMLVGVHGTPKIALRNPLTDDDISGMTYYFKNTTNPAPN